MEIEIGSVVIAKAGRDKGAFFAVISCDDGFCYIANGRRRSVFCPKKKNSRHVVLTKYYISKDSLRGDTALRRALAEIAPGKRGS